MDWKRILAAVRRRKFTIILITLVGSAAGIGLGSLMPATYVVEARVWIENPGNRGPEFGPIQTTQLLETNAWEELLRSYRVMDDVVRKRKLYLSFGQNVNGKIFDSFDVGDHLRAGAYVLRVDRSGRRFTLVKQGRDARPMDQGQVGDSIGSGLGFRWAPPAKLLQAGLEAPFEVQTIRDASRGLAQRLGTQMDQKGNFLRVDLRGTKPDRLAATLNAIVRRFVDVADELKHGTLSEKTHILEEQLRTAQKQLQAADAALESFRVKTIALPRESSSSAASSTNASDPVIQQFFQLKLEREDLERSRQAIARAMKEGTSGSFPLETLEGIPAVQKAGELQKLLDDLTSKRAELRTLRLRYTDDSQPVTKLKGEIDALEGEALPNLLDRLVQELKNREATLDSQLQSQSDMLEKIPPRMLQEARLQRNVSLDEQIYTTLQQRYEEARLAEVSSIPDLRILDAAAVPDVPESQQGSRILLMAFIGSLGLALAGAVLLDRLDGRVRYPSQVTQGMGLNILGAIPRMKAGKRKRHVRSQAEVLEAFRSLRLNVDHAFGAAGPVIITITGSGPGDGKSFVTANLAGAFARHGRRTVVVDGDTRRGTQHDLLGGRRKPGLTDYLEGVVSVEAVIQEVEHSLLDFIGCGTRTRNSPEQLNSRRMRTLLADLKSRYDVVLVDTPPIQAGVDALALSALTGNLLFVVRTGSTDLSSAEANLDHLDQLPVRVLGAVLNEIPRGERIYRHYSYLSTYEIEPETRDGVIASLPSAGSGAS